MQINVSAKAIAASSMISNTFDFPFHAFRLGFRSESEAANAERMFMVPAVNGAVYHHE